MRTFYSLFVFLVCLGCVLAVTPLTTIPTTLVKSSKFFVNGKEFCFKGVNYSPAPLGQEQMSNGYGGTGFCSAKLTPWNEWKSACYDSDYYDGSTDINPARFPQGMAPIWQRDFARMQQLGINTLRMYNMNPSTRAATIQYTNMYQYATGKDHTQFLRMCEANGFYVIYPLFTDDNSYNTMDEYSFKRLLRFQIDEAASSPSVIMWQFGNEMGWLWYGSSTWNDPTATAKFNGYVDYIKRYTLTKWGRTIPVTCAIPNFQDQYNYQYQNWHVDIFSANVFFENYDGLFAGDGTSDFLGVSTLSCIYNKPFLMTEIGPTWAPGTPYPTGALNEIWFNVIKNMPNGLIGAVWFEFTDEPALGKDFGLFSFSANTVAGISSTQVDGFVPDLIVEKQQWWDAIYGTYNGGPYNFPTDMYQLMGRGPTFFNNVTDRCAGQGLYNCPGSAYPKCSGNGACDRTTGTCTCAVGWSGSTCASAVCPKSTTNGYTCGGHGVCSTAVTPPECACNYGYYGAACDVLVSSVPAGQCPGGCSEGSGVCNQTLTGAWVCNCHPGWTGPDCSITDLGVGTLGIQQNFMGCLKNAGLTVNASVSTTQTNQKCRYWCAMRNYQYAGTTSGNTCLCGNTLASTSTTSCYSLCNGDTRQVCGSPSATAVSTYVSGNVVGAGYLGCYIDTATRDLPILVSDGVTISIDTCRQTCAAQGYKYAGLQNACQCFCGNSFGNQGGLVPDSQCNYPCWGAYSSFMCGAGWRNSIYTATLPVGYAYGL